MSADRGIEAGLAGRKAHAGLEPLPIRGHQADEGDRCCAETGCQTNDVVEPFLGWRIEDGQRVKGCEAGGVADGLLGVSFCITGGRKGRIAPQLRSCRRPGIVLPAPGLSDRGKGAWCLWGVAREWPALLQPMLIMAHMKGVVSL